MHPLCLLNGLLRGGSPGRAHAGFSLARCVQVTSRAVEVFSEQDVYRWMAVDAWRRYGLTMWGGVWFVFVFVFITYLHFHLMTATLGPFGFTSEKVFYLYVFVDANCTRWCCCCFWFLTNCSFNGWLNMVDILYWPVIKWSSLASSATQHRMLLLSRWATLGRVTRGLSGRSVGWCVERWFVQS